jgi:hypothetical protein
MSKAVVLKTIRLISQLLDAIETLPREQLAKLLDGKARLILSVEDAQARKPKAPRKKRAAKLSASPMPPMRFPDLRKNFESAASREECKRLVAAAFTQKNDMLAFMRSFDWPAQKNDSKNRLCDLIVEMTAGNRIDSEIIRGGY